MPELIKQCHALPPHPCEYDSGAATPGVERRKLALKIDKLLADLGQVVPGQGAALNRVRLARGRRLVRGLPTGDQIEEFFTCPDGAHSVLHIARKNVQVWHCGEYGECGECGHKKFSKKRKKARRGAGRRERGKKCFSYAGRHENSGTKRRLPIGYREKTNTN